MIKLGGVTDSDGVVSLSVGSNVITVEVTAEDDSTTKTYTVTVTRAAAPISEPDLVVPFVYTSSSLFGYSPSFTLGVTVENQGSGSSGSTTLRYYRSTDSAITSGDAEVGTDAVDGLAASGRSTESIDLIAPSAPGTYYYGACVDAVSNESDATNSCSGSIAFTVPGETSTDATLSALTLSDINIGTFASGTTSYTADVANSVTETTVTPTVNHSGASYVVKLGGVTDSDGVVSLSVGSNIITIEVTAEDGETTKAYNVAVTRAAALSTDATLSSLTLSRIDFGTFASGTTSYTASVANSVSQTTVAPTVNHSGATYVIKLDGVEDSDGVISLSVGSNIITIEVTAEDGENTRTYTVAVTRADALSTDATLSGLTLSGVDYGTFASDTTSYTTSFANSVSQTTVTPTVNHSGASYAIKLGGVTDEDGAISLSVGANVITIEVTAEDAITTQTYTVTVTRDVSNLRGPSLCVSSGAVTDQTNTGLVSDCDTLLAAKETLARTANLNWSADSPIGKWEGVTVRGMPERVVWLDLRAKGLDGSVPAELGQLSKLTYLNLRTNQLTGEIPSELGSLANLRELNLHVNQLTGEIPAELGGLANLQSLDLGGNQLTGEIPVWLGSLANLEELHLGWNQLTGPIPAELGSLANLQS